MAPARQLKICKDSRRCQGYYLHGYRILQHQVQIKFLEASLSLSGFFPQDTRIGAAAGLSQQQCRRVGRQRSPPFFITCGRPATKLYRSALFLSLFFFLFSSVCTHTHTECMMAFEPCPLRFGTGQRVLRCEPRCGGLRMPQQAEQREEQSEEAPLL